MEEGESKKMGREKVMGEMRREKEGGRVSMHKVSQCWVNLHHNLDTLRAVSCYA